MKIPKSHITNGGIYRGSILLVDRNGYSKKHIAADKRVWARSVLCGATGAGTWLRVTYIGPKDYICDDCAELAGL